MRWRVAALAVVGLAALGWGGYEMARNRTPRARADTLEEPGAPAGAAELALVAPLAPGAALADYQVRSIQGATRGAIRVFCERGRAQARLEIALAGSPVLAPATTGHYAIYYTARDADPADGQRLASALAAIVGQHLSLPTPPGLTVFTPQSEQRH